MTMEYARRYPILTVACGPTNSIRGASYLSKLANAIVIDVGGTTTDVGVIQNEFPRESSVAVTIGGVRTNFRMPDVMSIGLGGGSIVREKADGTVTVGPDSVGFELTEKALVFGGDTLTATDIAVRLGMADIGDASLVKDVPYELAEKALDAIPNVAPGTIECPVAQRKVRKLTIEEIKKSVEVFGKGCGRLKRSGFDAITIHAHCGYLIAEFLSPYFNNRDDEYGGSLENRARFLLELVASCRENIGPNMPIIVRLAMDEFIGDTGRQLAETVELCKMLEAAGVDALDCGAGLFQTMSLISPPVYYEKGFMADMTSEIKKAVSIPVIVQGRLQDPEVAEMVLEEGKADFVAMGRAWIAEPEWVNKVACGDLDGMRRCISCDHCIGDRIAVGNQTLRCTLNAMAGREHRFPYGYPKAAEKKKVVVIGAGPAGLEATYRLAMRGHDVELYDKADKLCGGEQIVAASTPPCKDNLMNVRKFYETQFSRMDNVMLHLGQEITKESAANLDGDAVVLATGATPIAPPIPGLRDNPKVVTAIDVLAHGAPVEGKVVIAGGGQVGVETAHWLAEKGFKDVAVVEMMSELSIDGELMTKLSLHPLLEESGVKSYVSHQIRSINDDSVTVYDMNGDREFNIEADTVVNALGKKPLADLEEPLRKQFDQYYVIGDARGRSNICTGIEQGFITAMKI